MFSVSLKDIEMVLHDFGIFKKVSSYIELQCYNYENENQELKYIRLICKVIFTDNSAVVARFRNEADVSLGLAEAQGSFAELLRLNGISCPLQYKTDGLFAKWYTINGYKVIVTVEEFMAGELEYVDMEIAGKTGRLLARAHNISEKHGFHVRNKVLFNPFKENDLFSFRHFNTMSNGLPEREQIVFHKIVKKYNDYMEILSPLKSGPCYAVQGDISNCNMYQLQNGCLGIFDFNRCGDNNLYCDAVMQAVFESRLMDYPVNYTEKDKDILLSVFLEGYQSERPFNNTQKEMFPYLYAVINAFWSVDIIWDDKSLLKEYNRKNYDAVHKWLEEIWKRLSVPDAI